MLGGRTMSPLIPWRDHYSDTQKPENASTRVFSTIEMVTQNRIGNLTLGWDYSLNDTMRPGSMASLHMHPRLPHPPCAQGWLLLRHGDIVKLDYGLQ